MIDKPKVGDMVWVKYQHKDSKLEQTTVERVGRVYFAVKTARRPLEFSMETEIAGFWGRTRDRSSYDCWRDETALARKQQYDADRQEKCALMDQLNKVFGIWGTRERLTLDQLRRVKAIVEEQQKGGAS